jgi:hypothetical protein
MQWRFDEIDAPRKHANQRSCRIDIPLWMELPSEYNIQSDMIYEIQMFHKYLLRFMKKFSRDIIDSESIKVKRSHFDDPFFICP